MFCCLSSPPLLSISVLCLGSEFRVGRSPGRHEENAERHAACRERQGRKRQVQNPASNPPGQHQAAHWWVWVHVNQGEGWTQWWNQTVRVIAMPTPHFLCKAQNLLPPQELLLLLFFSIQEKERLTGSVASASPKPSSVWPITLLPAF